MLLTTALWGARTGLLRLVDLADCQASARVIERPVSRTKWRGREQCPPLTSAHRKRHTHTHTYHISCTHVLYTSSIRHISHSHPHIYITHSHPHTIPHAYTHAEVCIQSQDLEHSRSQAPLQLALRPTENRFFFLSKRFIF